MKKFLITYFTALFFVFTFLSAGGIDSQDGFLYMSVARNIYYTGEPTGPVDETKTRQNIPMSVTVGGDGKTYSATGLGFSLAFLPAVALTDLFYKIYQVTPPQHFPLDADWMIGLFAGFTNSFFGALLGVVLFVYFIKLGLNKKQALIMSLSSLFVTNLLAYSKHTFAHMMFLTFLTASFLFLKLYTDSRKAILLLLSGLAFGISVITYNSTFILTVIPLIIYYLLLKFKNKFTIKSKISILKDILMFALGAIPFLIVFLWYDNLRWGNSSTVAVTTSMITSYASDRLPNFPLTVFFEGIWGQLFSPGRSIFIYSPILLLIIIFWHKLKSSLKPEIITFILISIIYILFYSSFFTRGHEGIASFWHGESSWGPRYLTPIIPFGMLLVGSIYKNLSRKAKLFVLYPLVLIGVGIGILGSILPYQIKYHDTEKKFWVNGSAYINYLYINLLPRYSPVMKMPKELIKLAISFPATFQHGIYNVQFIDGIYAPFNVGRERWRTIEERGYITFDDYEKDPVKKFNIGLINHPLGESKDTAQINFSLNGHSMLQKPVSLIATERQQIEIPVQQKFLYPKNNQLVVEVTYPDNSNSKTRSQLLSLLAFFINDHAVNTESLDFPYVSGFGPTMMGVEYKTFGGKITDPWVFWETRTQLYERVPDFWWVRNLYYWDIPKSFTLGLLTINFIGFCSSFLLARKFYKKYK